MRSGICRKQTKSRGITGMMLGHDTGIQHGIGIIENSKGIFGQALDGGHGQVAKRVDGGRSRRVDAKPRVNAQPPRAGLGRGGAWHVSSTTGFRVYELGFSGSMRDIGSIRNLALGSVFY